MELDGRSAPPLRGPPDNARALRPAQLAAGRRGNGRAANSRRLRFLGVLCEAIMGLAASPHIDPGLF